MKYSEKTEKKIKTILGITTASILALLFLAYMFLRILFWAETGSFFPTVQKSRSVEIAISCDPFDVLAVREELAPYTKDYTTAGVEMIYAEYHFSEDGVTAMYGFTGVKYRLGRGETISFYLDAEKGTVEEISYYAAGAKVFSSYPSHYFDADVNMMEEYEKIKIIPLILIQSKRSSSPCPITIVSQSSIIIDAKPHFVIWGNESLWADSGNQNFRVRFVQKNS